MENSGDVRSLKIALGAYVIVLALKLVVDFMSGTMALLAEALHTLSDIFVSGFLLAAAHYSRRAPGRCRSAHAARPLNPPVYSPRFSSYSL